MKPSEQKQQPAKRLHKVMTDRGFNINRLAKQAGVAPSVISRILSEKRDFKATTAVKLAKGLGVSTDYLLGVTHTTPDNQLERARRLVARLDGVLWEGDI